MSEEEYQSTEEDSPDFLLVTSKEFCHGGSASRTTRDREDENVEELEELRHWDQEEAQKVAAAEVAQLLREVPPGLRSRYCARLRAEAQRRRAAEALGGHSRVPRFRLLWAAWALWACAVVGQAAHYAHSWTATMTPNAEQEAHGPGARASCVDALRRSEDKAISLEVLTKRDIMGYTQMLAAVHDWASTMRSRVPAVGPCVQVEGARFLNLVQKVRSALLATHDRKARARVHLAVERQAKVSLQ
ncbi:unnamed protein product [Effrenium voratum]|nr:unnamed protein product [Effrenium voratum]CAJ1447568.1 unnamed protein product [Effrenium voratum]